MAVPVQPVQWGNQPVVDVSKLYDSFQQGRSDARANRVADGRQEALSSLPMNPDGSVNYGAAATKLLQIGDLQGAQSFAQLADTQAQRGFQQMQFSAQQANADRAYGLQERALSAKPIPAGYQQTSNGLQPIPGGPSDPNTIRAQAQARGAGRVGSGPNGGKISTNTEKAILEADDMVQEGQNVLSNLDTALSLNDKAYSGVGSSVAPCSERIRGPYGGDALGVTDTQRGAATTDFQNLIGTQALGSLKAIFGVAPTEGERKVLLDLQASVDKSPAERRAIITRARELAQKRIEFNRNRAESLRSGTYYRNDPASPAQSAAPAAQFQNGQIRRTKSGAQFQYNNGAWEPVQ